MGLIKAIGGAVGGVLADQWKEYFYCDALPAEVIARKGEKRTSGRSSNTKGEDNIISNGSVIAIADGQCMCIVEQGKVVDICAEPGEYTYDMSTEPSIFAGKLSDSILDTFRTIGKRFTFGGDTAKDQRVYYFNTKELIGNKYGTPNPVPFRVVDERAGIDIDINIRCFGEYSYRLADPILFYTNVCGNVAYQFTRTEIDSQLKTELLTALQPAFAKISSMGIRYSALPGHTMEMADALNEVLSEKWRGLRGIEIVSFGVSSVKAEEEDEKMLKEMQRNAAFMDPTRAAAHLVGAQAAAMQAAAANEGAGAAMAFMGMNMAQGAGGINAQNLYAMGQQQAAQQPKPAPAAQASGWTCSCGAVNTGKFCTNCGAAKPADGWVCSCGAVNKGKFCSECGAKKPAGEPLYKCDKCGWEPEDPKNPPKFCPECGDPFNSDDIK
ncbi:MAG: SPFH domain-containing protein [Oscillospiraceae bacterium]|nr:SPFH domain-containing protein [Oscillospiraceae bacterium]MBQ4642889.1 SPFH domain-containing protein [Oscillospiraceae bacterium]